MYCQIEKSEINQKRTFLIHIGAFLTDIFINLLIKLDSLFLLEGRFVPFCLRHQAKLIYLIQNGRLAKATGISNAQKDQNTEDKTWKH